MVIIASHTAGGNLTVFLPRKHPRLCPRSLTTWMAAKLSSSYYNHLITEAPPCALPVFFFFFLLLYLQDCCETCCITSKVILMRECTGITCCSKWCPHDNGRAEVDQTGEHLIRKKNTKKTIVLLPVQEYVSRVLLPKRTRWCFCFGARHQKRSWPSQFEPLSWEK